MVVSFSGKWQKLFSAPAPQCCSAVSAGQQVPASTSALSGESFISVVSFSQSAAAMKPEQLRPLSL